MNDEQKTVKLYKRLYAAMIAKDSPELEAILDESFVLVHMTGMRQTKKEFIGAIADGTLNYFSAEHEELRFAVKEDTARLTGKSRVTAAVFGGERSTWRLRLELELVKKDQEWYYTKALASAYSD